MGGHAFAALLGASARFPRMDKPTYEKLKTFVSSRLATAYSSVGIASEDPEKPDFGDLDVVVNIKSAISSTKGHVSDVKEELKVLLMAQYSVSNGPQFVSFAVSAGTLNEHSHSSRTLKGEYLEEEVHESDPLSGESQRGPDDNTYYQVDFNLTEDESQKEFILFYNSYGDLGNILCMLTKTLGMVYSRKGLRLAFPTYTEQLEHRPFVLSNDTSKILSGLGLDYNRWKKGFHSRTAIFEWVFESRFASKGDILNVLPTHMDRPMYRDFVHYVENVQEGSYDRHLPETSAIIEEMLGFFDKQDEFRQTAESVRKRKALKSNLNGKLVQEVTGLDGPMVGQVIMRLKSTFSEDELLGKSADEMRVAIQHAHGYLV
ncbi:hypothetical protein CPB86DRAFT_816576 [Serendipita vermifera]|nr:hypothetical protein CPB86DRAFT_816576 [Serendipita vermifera]